MDPRQRPSAGPSGAESMYGLRKLIHLLPLALLLSASCSDREAPTAPDSAPPIFGIADGAHSGGNPHFFFLPPLAADPNATGAFDASVAPHVAVAICEWTAAGCATPLVAEFTTASGPGSETLRLDAEDEHYIVNWHTSRSGLDPEKNYRIRVLVAGTELGHLDVDVVRSGRDLKNVNTNHFVGVVNRQTVPIKFRIEEGAVYVVGPEARTFSTVDGAVTLDFPGGALAQPTGITVLPAVVHPADPTLVGGTAYQFGPDGASFAHPVQLTIRYGAAGVPTGVDEALLLIHRATGDHWREVDPRVDGSNADPAASAVTGAIHGFSTYAVLRQRPVASVAVTPDAATIDVGETVQLAAALGDAHGNPLIQRIGRTVAWSSSDEAVAGVDPAGLVTGLGGGGATVTAGSGGQSGSAAITVAGGGTAILRLEYMNLRYEPDAFGRRVRLGIRYRTGQTVIDDENDSSYRVCSETSLQNVAVSLELAPGLSFVADGRGVFDPASRTITWQLGTLDGSDSANCNGHLLEAVIEVGPSIADGAQVLTRARASTTTPGDDPADNARELSFQVGYLPVQVWMRNFRTPDCDGSWTLARPVGCERVTPGSVPAIASWSTSALPWQGEAIPRKVADLHPGGGYTFEVVTSTQARSGYDCTISSCTSLGASNEISGNNTLLQLYNPNPYPVHFALREELSAFASCNPPETSGPNTASVSFTWHNFDAPGLRCGWTGWYTPSQSWSQRRVLDSRSGTCEIERSDRTGTQRCLASPLHGGGFDLNSGSPRVRASAGTELVLGSGGTLESYQLGESQASARARWEVQIPR